MAEGIVRVLVVDDHEVVRAGLVSLLSRAEGLEVCGVASSGEEALSLLGGLAPDVAVVDYRLPGISGAETCERIGRRCPRTAVVILTSFVADEAILACLQAGARAVVTKDLACTDLARTVRAAAAGQAVLAPEVASRVIAWASRARESEERRGLLGPRELEVLGLMAQGLTNRDIGVRLHRSEASVKLHVRSIMRKLGARRRYQAVAAGIARGVI